MRQTFPNILAARDAIAAHVGAPVYLAEIETHPRDHVTLSVIRSESSRRIVGTVCETIDTQGTPTYHAMTCLPRGIE